MPRILPELTVAQMEDVRDRYVRRGFARNEIALRLNTSESRITRAMDDMGVKGRGHHDIILATLSKYPKIPDAVVKEARDLAEVNKLRGMRIHDAVNDTAAKHDIPRRMLGLLVFGRGGTGDAKSWSTVQAAARERCDGENLALRAQTVRAIEAADRWRKLRLACEVPSDMCRNQL